MAGLRIPLAGITFTGSTAPILPEIDPVAPNGLGGLLLIDASHPLGGFPAGVPTDNAVITNLLRAKAATLLGTAASSLDVTQRVVNMTSTLGKVERTPQGGIHAIQSTTQNTADQGYQAQIPLNIVAYMKANPTHQFYLSVWNKPTKLNTTSSVTDDFAVVCDTVANSMALGLGTVLAGRNLGFGWDGAALVGSSNDGRGTVNTPQCSAQATSTYGAGFTAATPTAGRYSVFDVSNFSFYNKNASLGMGRHGGRVFWRAYMEDLTVSGRSYATVLGLDLAEFTRQVMTVGGRFYGDTVPTDPTTFT
jgi:hypothetical protein